MEWKGGMEQKAGRDGDCVETRFPPSAHVGNSKNLHIEKIFNQNACCQEKYNIQDPFISCFPTFFGPKKRFFKKHLSIITHKTVLYRQQGVERLAELVGWEQSLRGQCECLDAGGGFDGWGSVKN